MVHTGSRDGAKQRWQQRPATRKSTVSHQRTSNETQKKMDAKTCYRCGTTSHLANYPKCPAKQSKCRQCGKVGHFARVCRSSASTCVVQEVDVPELTVLSIEMPLPAKRKHNLKCTVSLHTVDGNSIDTELLVDTGSAVSILPEHLYQQYFSDISLTVPNVRLVTYMQKTIPVLGCLTITASFQCHCTQVSFFIVPGGTPLLGMDLFTALHLDIRNGSVVSSAKNGQVAVNFTEPLGLAAGFVHKVNVRSDVLPIQQKLRRLPFAVRDAVSQELKRLESEGIIEKVESSPWVSPVVVIQKKTGGIRLCVDLREPNKAVVIDSHPLPHIEEIFTELRGASMFSTIDLQNAYHQVTLHEDSRDLTAFITLHIFLHTYRATPHAVTKLSPAELLHGRQIKTKLHVGGLPCVAPPKDQKNLKEIIQQSQNKMKEYTDRQRHANSPKIPVGSFVPIRKPGIIKKGHSKFTPPLKVVAHKGPATYLLADGRAWNAIHLAPTSPCVTTSDTVSLAEDSFKPLEAPQTSQMSISSPTTSRPH
ncbi:hypothetical protein DPX16_21123 [Anabarilius grahami]|uniref:CCHC-type domain-containing protein n=1 Tax=Anabarilius grahami TaxID=495550 RepID=A0A3N0Z3V7_ANAGA|nr:hypothetical protein DPX16_21123 [Anabarilius grahami]